MSAVEGGVVETRGPSPAASRALRMAAFAGLFVLAGLVGRATTVDTVTPALVWPAAGVAVLWYLVEGVGWRSPDVLALAGLSFAVNTLTGSSAAMGCVFVAANVAQALAVVGLCRRWRADLWGEGPPVATTRALMVLTGAAMAGCVVGTSIGVAGLWVTSDAFGVAGTLTWWGRNTVGIVGVTVVGLLLLHRRRSPGRQPRTRRRPGAWWLELAAVLAATGVLYAVELALPGAPISFLLPAILVWVGMRFSPTVAALQGLISGTGFVAVTLAGSGPFAGVDSPQYAALLSQLFVGISVVIGMVLAIYRAQAERLLGEVRRARRASDAQADVLATVIASMTEGVCVLDAQGSVRTVNPALERTLGASVVVGTPGRQVFALRAADGGELDPAELPADRALAGEVVGGVDFVTERPAGRGIVNVFATPLGDRGHRGAVVVVRDVTDERAHQRDLAGFARVVAHDLLNPIGAVDGWAEQLEETVAGRDGGELLMVGRIRAAAGRMRSLVSGLLAHATSADRTLEPEPLDLTALARDAALERGAPHRVRVAAIPAVEGDPVLVRQLLDNLVGNAVKYVAPGAEAEVEVSGETATDGRVRVRVADRGVGIPPGRHESVFADFERAHAAEYQGTGLGLAICRRIVERHDGTIAAHPRPGGGTVVELTLPAAALAPRPVRASAGARA